MLATELREKSTPELLEREESLSAELFNLKFQLATEQLSNTMKLRQTRRDLARVKTVLRERINVEAPAADAAQDEEA